MKKKINDNWRKKDYTKENYENKKEIEREGGQYEEKRKGNHTGEEKEIKENKEEKEKVERNERKKTAGRKQKKKEKKEKIERKR